MKNSKGKFRTTNLDLACVLSSQGYRCTMRKLGPINAEFVFESNADVEHITTRFMQGSYECNITAFMYARFALKRELNTKTVEWSNAVNGKLTLTPGQYYFFIDEGSRRPVRNVYANREPHLTRLMNNNAFLSMSEATASASVTKVD